MPTRKTQEPESTPDGTISVKTKPKSTKKGTKRRKSARKLKDLPREPQHAPEPKEVEIIRRRDKILDLRESGASIRQISAHLIAQGHEGCSPTRVHELLVDGLEDMLKTQRMKTKHVVQLELNKIDRVELKLLPEVLKKGNHGDIESLDRIWRRRDNLLGLHKPAKVQINAQEALAKLIGSKPEELPSGDVES